MPHHTALHILHHVFVSAPVGMGTLGTVVVWANTLQTLPSLGSATRYKPQYRRKLNLWKLMMCSFFPHVHQFKLKTQFFFLTADKAFFEQESRFCCMEHRSIEHNFSNTSADARAQDTPIKHTTVRVLFTHIPCSRQSHTATLRSGEQRTWIDALECVSTYCILICQRSAYTVHEYPEQT